MPLTLTFRDATPADTPAIVALVDRAFRGDASREGWTTEAELLDGRRTDDAAVREMITAPRDTLLLAHHAGTLLGSLLLRDEGAGTAYIGMLAVEPALQGQGFGRALLAEAERRVMAFGASTIRMTVIAQRAELVAWYERIGYHQTGEREPFPYGQPRFGVPKRDDLYFVVMKKAL